MSLKIIENFDARVQLNPEAQKALFQWLTHESFLEQIRQPLNCAELEFTECLFQPVPYSTATPKGMPPEFEQYHDSSEYYIINVPPNFMAKAKIFKPSRLCAIYRRLDGDRTCQD
ncbi:MAG: hypothetical protein ACLFQ7_09640 [Phormidium sp.]